MLPAGVCCWHARPGKSSRRRAPYCTEETLPCRSDMTNTNLNFTHEDVINMLSAIHDLIDETARIYNQYNNEPAATSLAFQEQSSFPNPGLVADVHSRGMLSIESAADHRSEEHTSELQSHSFIS